MRPRTLDDLMTSSNTTRTISDVMADPSASDAFLGDAEAVLATRVASSRGLTGVAVRTGFATFQRVKPRVVRAALQRLAPHFGPVLDRHWAAATTSGDVRASFSANAETIARDLLCVTDGLAKRADNAVLSSIYTSLRGRAQDEVAAAMPDVSGLLRRHLLW